MIAGSMWQREVSRRTEVDHINESAWGVLALNTNKKIYRVGEKAKIDISILNEAGIMICGSPMKLVVSDPMRRSIELSTENGGLEMTPSCSKHEKTDEPDYKAEYQINKEGKYRVELIASTRNGERKIVREFEAQHEPAWEVERRSATRIFPAGPYQMEILIKAHRDFSGEVIEKVPRSFGITSIDNYPIFEVSEANFWKEIRWKIEIRKGEEISLAYLYQVPQESPAYYETAALAIESKSLFGDYRELGGWQLAVDAPTGPNYPQSIVSTGSWAGFTTTNLGASDGSRALLNSTTYNAGVVSNFGFNIGSSSIIDGVVVEYGQSIAQKRNTSTMRIRISANGGSSWSTYSTPTTVTDTTSTVDQTAGGSTDLWGLTLTPSVINSSTNFQVEISAMSNASNRPAGLDYVRVTVYSHEAPISISGTCKQLNGSNCTDTGTLRVAVGNSLQGQTQTTVGGTWSIANVTAPSANSVITVYIEGAADSQEAVAVTKYDGSGDITGIELHETKLSVGSDDLRTGANAITNANIGNYDYSASGNKEDIFVEVDTNNDLTTCAVATCTSNSLIVKAGNEYRPDSSNSGYVTTHDLTNNGTITADANYFYVSGGWDNNATFTAGSSTVTFTATSGTETIDSVGSGSSYFYAVNMGGGSGNATWNLSSALDINGNLSIAYGTLAMNGANTINLAGNLSIGSSGAYSKNGTTAFTFDGVSISGWSDESSGQDMGAVVINGAAKTINLGSSVKATSLNVASGQTLGLASTGYVLTILGTGTGASRPFIVSGTLNEGTNSTVEYAASAAAVEVQAETYHHLTLAPAASGSPSYTLGTGTSQSVVVNGNLTIGDGTNGVSVNADTYDPTLSVNGNLEIKSNAAFIASSFQTASAFTIAGNFTNNGSFTHSSGRVTFNGNNQTLSNDNTTSFYQWYISGTSARTVTFGGGSHWAVADNGTASFTGSEGNLLTLQSSDSNDWYLEVSNTGTNVTVSYTLVSHSNANSYKTIVASDGTNENGGSNSNWVFMSLNATANSFQRKTFFDAQNSRYWRFHQNGSGVAIDYSTDGSNWNPTSSLTSYRSSDFSVWQETVSTVSYVWMAVTDGYDIKVLRGILGTTDITWDNDIDTVMDGSSGSEAYAYPYISADSAQYLFVGARHLSGSSYYFKISRSTSSGVNDFSTVSWSSAQSLYTTTSANVYGNVASTGSQNMYSVFTAGADIKGCKYNNSASAWQSSDGSACGQAASAASAAKIDDAGDPGPQVGSGREVVRTTGNVLYAAIEDGGTIEMWRSTDGSSWSQQNPLSSPTGEDPAVALDNNGSIHMIYRSGNDLQYQTFDTASNTFGTPTEIITLSHPGGTMDAYSIAIDGSSRPHVVAGYCAYDDFQSSYFCSLDHMYNNSGWSLPNNVETPGETFLSGYFPATDIAFNDNGYPVIIYIAGDSVMSLEGAVGNSNLAISFSSTTIDASALPSAHSISLTTAANGTLFAAYIDAGISNLISLGVSSNGGSSWSTTTNSNEGELPSVVTVENQAYVFYKSLTTANSNDLVYDKYNGSTWSGENVVSAGTYAAPRVRAGKYFSHHNFVVDYLYSDGTDVYFESKAFDTDWCNDSSGTATCDSNWTKRRKVTLDNSASAETLVNFPILIKVDSNRISYANTKDQGQDIRFVDPADPTVALSHEIESWNESGSSFIWVKVPYVNATATTDYVWMYYGNSNASDGQDATNVWDSNYAAVWHMNNDPTGTAPQLLDSTANNNDGTAYNSWQSTDLVDGTAGKALDFRGGHYFRVSDNASLNVTSNNGFTTSMFVKSDVYDASWRMMMVRDADLTIKWFMSQKPTSTGHQGLEFHNGTSEYGSTAAFDTTNPWYLTLSVSTTQTIDYFNATPDRTLNQSITLKTGDVIDIGGRPRESSWFDGRIDEVRISNKARSADWIEAEYKSLNDQINSFGNEESSAAYGSDSVGSISEAFSTNLSFVYDTASARGHLIFVNTSGNVVYSRYTDSATDWSTNAATIDTNSGNGSVSLTWDSNANHLYAFYIRGDHIYYKKATYSSGPSWSWDSSPTDWVSSGINAYLNSNYSANSHAFAEWTSGSGGIYNLNWQEISTGGGGNSAPKAPQSPYVNNVNARSGQTNPTGLYDLTPAFSAIFDDDNTSDTAGNYEIEVGNDSDWGDGAEMWDTGKSSQNSCNENSRCEDVIYSGSTLSGGSTYYWRIKFWDNSDAEGEWSATQTFTTDNFPTISSVTLNGGADISLMDNSTKSVSWTAIVTDLDGNADIATASGMAYRSGVTGAEGCSPNNNNCYAVASCSKSDCSGNACTFSCSANFLFHTDPTSASSPYPSEYWVGMVRAYDAKGVMVEGFNTPGSPDVNTLRAIDTSSALNFPPLLPGDSTEDSNSTMVITNTGNVEIDTEVYGDNLCTDYPTCSQFNISVSNQRYSTTSLNYSQQTALSGSPAVVDINIAKPTTSPSNSIKSLYWGIAIPSTKETGTYTGRITIGPN